MKQIPSARKTITVDNFCLENPKVVLEGSGMEEEDFGEQALEDDFEEDDGGDDDDEDSIEREIEENDLVDEVGSG